ncbi:MAG: hypothetical protein PHC86_01115 [Eubacteriales bacterium]|nr:hypothetical protein [Eubacteriales bacterium]
MSKITLQEFYQIISDNMNHNQSSIEVEFRVENSLIFQSCWLGRISDSKWKSNIFWFGLAEDGSKAYKYSSFEEFLNSKVFEGKSIIEIWESIDFISIDGCDVYEYFSFV